MFPKNNKKIKFFTAFSILELAPNALSEVSLNNNYVSNGEILNRYLQMPINPNLGQTFGNRSSFRMIDVGCFCIHSNMAIMSSNKCFPSRKDISKKFATPKPIISLLFPRESVRMKVFLLIHTFPSHLQLRARTRVYTPLTPQCYSWNQRLPDPEHRRNRTIKRYLALIKKMVIAYGDGKNFHLSNEYSNKWARGVKYTWNGFASRSPASPAETSRFPSPLRDSAEALNEILSGRPSAKYFRLQKFMNFSLPRTFPFVGEGTKQESQHCRRCDRWKREKSGWIPSTAWNWRFPICLSTVAVSLPASLWRHARKTASIDWFTLERELLFLRRKVEIMLSVVLDACS